MTLNPAEGTVKPGETLVIRLTISVPVEMASAGYWCALTVDEVPDPMTVASGVGVQFLADNGQVRHWEELHALSS